MISQYMTLVYPQSCTTITTFHLKTFLSPLEREPIPISNYSPFSQLPLPQAATDLLSVIFTTSPPVMQKRSQG